MKKYKLRLKYRAFAKSWNFISSKALLRYYAIYNPIEREY